MKLSLLHGASPWILVKEKKTSISWLNDWLTDWLIDWLTDKWINDLMKTFMNGYKWMIDKSTVNWNKILSYIYFFNSFWIPVGFELQSPNHISWWQHYSSMEIHADWQWTKASRWLCVSFHWTGKSNIQQPVARFSGEDTIQWSLQTGFSVIKYTSYKWSRSCWDSD
jgi:hypothetical protein